MGLSKLIDNQTISIDNHHAGMTIRADDKGLHIHKTINGQSKKGKIEIRIPLNGNEEIDFSNFRDNKFLTSKLRKEIIEALEDKARVQNFVTEVLNWIKENGEYNGMNQNDLYEIAEKAIVSLRKFFDSYPEVKNNFETIGSKVIGHFWPAIMDDRCKELFIQADTETGKISITRERRFLP